MRPHILNWQPWRIVLSEDPQLGILLFGLIPCTLKYRRLMLYPHFRRYIQIPASEVDTELLQDAARKENASR